MAPGEGADIDALHMDAVVTFADLKSHPVPELELPHGTKASTLNIPLASGFTPAATISKFVSFIMVSVLPPYMSGIFPLPSASHHILAQQSDLSNPGCA